MHTTKTYCNALLPSMKRVYEKQAKFSKGNNKYKIWVKQYKNFM